MIPNRHISDEDLLRAVDGELDGARAHDVQAHLNHCAECRARKSKLKQTGAQFVQLVHGAFDPKIPGEMTPAAKFQERVLKLASEAQIGNRQPKPAASPYWMAAAAGVLIVALVAVLVHSSSQSVSAASLPNSILTPGATRPISKEQLCSLPAEDEGRTVPAGLAMRVFREYGIRQPPPRAYEMDYLITPSLGGAEEARNLWPQPYNGNVWTARVKDALEDHLRTLVCKGEIELAAAQSEMASNWIAAYKKYFHTIRPLPAHSTFTKDRPWE